MLDSYVYEVATEWSHGRSGRILGGKLPPIEISAPPEFSGEAGKWTPEHLLLGATAGCFLTTFAALAHISHLNILGYRCRASGRLEKVAGEGYRFTEIVLVPELSIAGEDRDKAARIVAKAERNCFISNSLRIRVQVEPQFVLVGTAAMSEAG